MKEPRSLTLPAIPPREEANPEEENRLLAELLRVSFEQFDALSDEDKADVAKTAETVLQCQQDVCSLKYYLEDAEFRLAQSAQAMRTLRELIWGTEQ